MSLTCPLDPSTEVLQGTGREQERHRGGLLAWSGHQLERVVHSPAGPSSNPRLAARSAFGQFAPSRYVVVVNVHAVSAKSSPVCKRCTHGDDDGDDDDGNAGIDAEIMIGSVELVAIAVQVSGTVQYGGDNDTRKLFSQSFLVLGIPQDNITVPRIMNDMLRWITPAIPPPPRQRYSHSQKRRDRTLVGGVGKKSKFAGKKKKKN